MVPDLISHGGAYGTIRNHLKLLHAVRASKLLNHEPRINREMNSKLNGDVNYKSYGSIYTSLTKHERKNQGPDWFVGLYVCGGWLVARFDEHGPTNCVCDPYLGLW